MKKRIPASKIIYFYYNKKKIALYGLLGLLFLLVYLLKTYEDIINHKIEMMILHIFVIPTAGLLLFTLLKLLFHRNPAFNISDAGITDYRNYCISWNQVKHISPFTYNKTSRCLVIWLHDSTDYFGTYQSLFGRRPIVLDSSYMYVEEQDKKELDEMIRSSRYKNIDS